MSTKPRKPLKLNLKKGGVSVMQIYHDDWCNSNTKKGRNLSLCNCNTEMKIVETDNSHENIMAAMGIRPGNE